MLSKHPQIHNQLPGEGGKRKGGGERGKGGGGGGEEGRGPSI